MHRVILYEYKYLGIIILHEYTERFPLYNIYAISKETIIL